MWSPLSVFLALGLEFLGRWCSVMALAFLALYLPSGDLSLASFSTYVLPPAATPCHCTIVRTFTVGNEPHGR